jgi:hypothetical protein
MDFRVGKRPLIGRDMTSAIWQLAHNQTKSEFVRYWPLADILTEPHMSAFGERADIALSRYNVRRCGRN